MYVPLTICESSGSDAEAASSNVKSADTLFVPPVSAMSSVDCPSGPTSNTSTSSANVCVRPVSVTFTSVTAPSPDTAMSDG